MKSAHMEFDTTKLMKDLYAIPDEIVNTYFGSRMEDYVNSVERFTSKVDQFYDIILLKQRPIRHEYLLSNSTTICQKLPELMCSIVYIGRNDPSLIFPKMPIYPKETQPDWTRCDFDIIVQAEELVLFCRFEMTKYFDFPFERQNIYNDLKSSILRFAGTEGCRDIRRIYYLQYASLKMELNRRYSNLDDTEEFTFTVGKHRDLWLKLIPWESEAAIQVFLEGFSDFDEEIRPILRQSMYKGIDDSFEESNEEERFITENIDVPDITQQEGQQLDYLFFQEGDYWTLSYGGEQCRIRKLNGLIFIHYLLSHPGEPVHVSDFVKLVDRPDTSIVNKVDEDTASASRIADPAAIYKKDKKTKEVAVEETVDYDAIQAVRDALMKVEEEMARAHEAKDTSRDEQLNRQYEGLKKYIRDNTDHRGRPRKVQAAEKKAQERVQKAITRAVERIREYLPDLADHLSSAIETGFECVYKPLAESSTRWQL